MRSPASPRHLLRPAIALTTALMLIQATGSATQVASMAVLKGKIINAEGRPLSGAAVSLVGSTSAVTSGADGSYGLPNVPHGTQMIEVHLIGYRTYRLRADFESGRTLEQDIQLELEAIPLAAVEVVALDGLSPAMKGFYERRDRGVGHFFTRDDISKMQARQVTDVIRRVPGAQVIPATNTFGSGEVISMGRSMGARGQRACPVLYFLNGMPFALPQEAGINNFVRPDEIAGIEVYSGSSRIPAQFNATKLNARCGVIVIWTQAGEPKTRQQP